MTLVDGGVVPYSETVGETITLRTKYVQPRTVRNDDRVELEHYYKRPKY